MHQATAARMLSRRRAVDSDHSVAGSDASTVGRAIGGDDRDDALGEEHRQAHAPAGSKALPARSEEAVRVIAPQLVNGHGDRRMRVRNGPRLARDGVHPRQQPRPVNPIALERAATQQLQGVLEISLGIPAATHEHVSSLRWPGAVKRWRHVRRRRLLG
jgi:hypothetical protein